MRPINATVLVKVDVIQQTDSGIEKPKTDNLTGIVEAVGDGTPDYPIMKTKVGDHIRWFKNAGDRISYNGQNYILLNEEKREIAAIL